MTLEEEMKHEGFTHRVRIIAGVIMAVILGILWAMGAWAFIIPAFCGVIYLLGTLAVKAIDALNKKFEWWN